MGWNLRYGLPTVVSQPDIPDRSWYGNAPEVLAELRGATAQQVIPRLLAAVASYPYPRDYVLWPGPNSNTFTAHVLRHVPELRAELPVTAIGKDYLANGTLFARAPSGTGFQVSVMGLAGVLLAWREGIEFNLLGLTFGVDFMSPAIKLPGIGRIGFQ